MADTHLYDTTDCYYWIDGNTNAATPVVGATATFNVDDPTFWPPMPVLSGLASGFCERMAVAKQASAGGAIEQGEKVVLAPGATWTLGAAVAGDITSNSNIVKAVANGFALGSVGNALYAAGNNATFGIVGSSAGSNYMKAVDAAITTLIPGQSLFVKPDGASYDFDTLAAAADTRAGDTVGSAISLPVSNGGALNAPFKPAYPVEWAKERKWMLDELRWTGSTTTPIIVSGVFHELYRLNEHQEYFAGIGGATIGSAIAKAYNTVFSSGSVTDTDSSLKPNSIISGVSGALFVYQTYDDVYISAPTYMYPEQLPATLEFLGGATTGQVINAYCGCINPMESTYYMWDEATANKLSANATVPISDNALYTVTDGATVTLTGGTTIQGVVISSGCTAMFEPTVIINNLCIMRGGAVAIQNPVNGSSYHIRAQHLYYDYKRAVTAGDDPLLTDITYITGENPTTGSEGHYYLIDGGILSATENAMISGVVVSGSPDAVGLLKVTGQAGVSSVIVTDYGICSAAVGDTTNAAITFADILSGGTVIASAATFDHLNIRSGGYANLENCSVNSLGLVEGATVNIIGNTVTTATNGNIIGIQGLTDVCIGCFEDFAFTLQENKWNTLTVTATRTAGTSKYAVISSVTSEGLQTQAVIDHITSLPDVLGAVSGVPMSSALRSLSSCTIWRNFAIMAVNGGTATTSTKADHYKDFRVRQFAEDPST